MMYRWVQCKARVEIWLYHDNNMRIEGEMIGFDEYMNIVLDNSFELDLKKKTRRPLGRLLFKGDNVALITKKKC